jgi:predicted enzyme related to lactoylglutathione lyase
LGFGTYQKTEMKVKGIAFVGIPVRDIARAREFYEGVLGLKLSEEMGQGHWIEYQIDHGTLALGNFPDHWKPSEEGTSVALEVENFDEAIKRLKNRQVPFDAEPFESPCCRMAVIKDPDGNKIIIHKLKPENEKEPCP